MAGQSETAEARAAREATDWFILLQEDPEDIALRARFEVWRTADPLNAVAWAMTQRTSSLLARVPPTYGDRWLSRVVLKSGAAHTDAHAQADASPFANQLHRRFFKRLTWFTAFALLACFALLAMPAIILQLQADYATGVAEIRTIELTDGSTLTLAPNSAVEVLFGAAERHINLLAGEAFFEVHHDPARPFHVNANGIKTTNLSTAFEVRRAATGAVIAVRTGSVRVEYPPVSPSMVEIVEAGQYVRVLWTGTIVRGDQVPTQIAAWRQKHLIAQDQSMHEVIDQLRPFFKGRIILMDMALAHQRVTGVYNLAEPANALRGIAQAQGAIVHEITPWVLVVSGH